MQQIEQVTQRLEGKGNGELFLHGYYYYYCLFGMMKKSLRNSGDRYTTLNVTSATELYIKR